MKKFLITLIALALFFGGIAGVYYFYRDTACSLTISVSPANSGVVLGNEETYESGATVELVANPATGYEFVAYSEGGTSKSTSADYSFVIRKDTALTATFRLKEYTLTFVDGEWSETRVLHYGDAIGALPTRATIWKIGDLIISANTLYNYTANQTAQPSTGTQVQTEKCNIVFNYSGIYSNELPTTMEIIMENAVVQDTIDNFFQNDYPTKSLVGNRDFIAWTTVNPNAIPTPTYVQLVGGIVDNEEALGNFVIEHNGQTVKLYAIWGAENSAGGDEVDTCNIMFNYSNVYSDELPTTMEITMENVVAQDTIENFFQGDYPTKSLTGNRRFEGWTTVNPNATPTPTHSQLVAGIVDESENLDDFVTDHNRQTVVLYAIWGAENNADGEEVNTCTIRFNFIEASKETGDITLLVNNVSTTNSLNDVLGDKAPLESASNNKLFVGWSTEDPTDNNLHVVIENIIDSTVALGTFVSQNEDETVDLYALWGQDGSSNDNEIITRTAIEFDYGVNETNINDTFVRSVNTVGGENDTLAYLYFGEATSSVLAVGDIIGEKEFRGFAYDTMIPYAIGENADLTPYILYYSGNITLYAIWQ